MPSPLRGRICIYVVGYGERYWQDIAFGEQHEKVDVRRHMPWDPALRNRQQSGTIASVACQDGFAQSVIDVVDVAITFGRCLCGAPLQCFLSVCELLSMVLDRSV